LQVHILKRRGPPLVQPLELPAHPARLAALLQARKGKGNAASPSTPQQPRSRSHVLDRTAALA
jgi:protein ImuA